MTLNRSWAKGAALFCSVSAFALSAGLAAAEENAADYIDELESSGSYLSGDKHNHTTCTDGAMSVQTVVNESLITYGLDWFAQTGHGGEGNRDCRFDDPEYNGAVSGSGDFWENTIGVENIGGDEEFSSGNGAGTFFGRGAREMWRWQSLSEYAYQLQRAMGEIADEPAWLGIEHNAPGHEHVSMAIVGNQFRNNGDAYATGQFEYLFDRSDDDTSGGDENDYTNPANNGIPKDFDRTGTAGHQRSIVAVEWLANNYTWDSYYVPAHVERQGGFDPNGNRGWNVEHFRDLHTAGLLNPRRPTGQSLVMGAEMIAGHQFANGGRGTYEADRPSAGFGTFGGAGAYSGAEIAVPGHDFDGAPLTIERLEEIRAELDDKFDGRLTEPSGADQYDSLRTNLPLERYVLARPGVQTMWDALLGEGRRFFNFGSSDWHNRGAFGPFEPQSTLDPWPGEYNKIYAYARGDDFGFNRRSTMQIIRGMRSGNTWSVMGDLIDDFYFVMCQGNRCATMGQELRVRRRGGDVVWMIKLRDPEGANYAPYTFDNPSLAQLGLSVPINEPVLSHIDVIRGDITGIIDPDDPAYTTNVTNPTTEIFASVDNMAGEFTEEDGYLIASGTIPARDFTNNMYFRVRGTNMPKGTPNETDADGNPLHDDYASFIPCFARGNIVDPVEVDASFSPFFQGRQATGGWRAEGPAAGLQFDPAACPEHLPVDSMGIKYLDADVEAWADLWFYANPIFVRAGRQR